MQKERKEEKMPMRVHTQKETESHRQLFLMEIEGRDDDRKKGRNPSRSLRTIQFELFSEHSIHCLNTKLEVEDVGGLE